MKVSFYIPGGMNLTRSRVAKKPSNFRLFDGFRNFGLIINQNDKR